VVIISPTWLRKDYQLINGESMEIAEFPFDQILTTIVQKDAKSSIEEAYEL
jgi:hypothetical protein